MLDVHPRRGRPRSLIAHGNRVAATAAHQGCNCRSASRVTPPGRRITGGSAVTSSTVDSRPIGVGPPSSTRSIRPSRSASTCCALVGAGPGETIGAGRDHRPHPLLRSVPGPPVCAGSRTATVSRPMETLSGTSGCRFSTSVSGPGQKIAASRLARSGMSDRHCRQLLQIGNMGNQRVVCGPSFGDIDFSSLPLRSGALAPSPYTVSVGNATRPPSRSTAAASRTASGSGCSPAIARIFVFMYKFCSSFRI